jgi:BASS family bile acid:Na+ symporter
MAEVPLYAKILSYLFVVVYMVSVAMESTQGEIRTMLKDTRRMGFALLANIVIVPILAFVLVSLLPLRPDIRIGVMMLAVSPGGLFALQFARIAKGDRVFAVALVIVLLVLAIFITPLLAHWFFGREGEGGLFLRLVLLFLLLVAVPLILGRELQKRFSKIAPKVGRWLGLMSILIFIITAAMTGRFKTPAIKALGSDGIVVIIVLTIVCWIVGWLMGGPEIRNRKVLAISTAMRNFGVCIPIALHYFPGTEVMLPILAFSGISIPMNMLFALVTGRMQRDPADDATPVEA